MADLDTIPRKGTSRVIRAGHSLRSEPSPVRPGGADDGQTRLGWSMLAGKHTYGSYSPQNGVTVALAADRGEFPESLAPM